MLIGVYSYLSCILGDGQEVSLQLYSIWHGWHHVPCLLSWRSCHHVGDMSSNTNNITHICRYRKIGDTMIENDPCNTWVTCYLCWDDVCAHALSLPLPPTLSTIQLICSGISAVSANAEPPPHYSRSRTCYPLQSATVALEQWVQKQENVGHWQLPLFILFVFYN